MTLDPSQIKTGKTETVLVSLDASKIKTPGTGPIHYRWWVKKNGSYINAGGSTGYKNEADPSNPRYNLYAYSCKPGDVIWAEVKAYDMSILKDATADTQRTIGELGDDPPDIPDPPPPEPPEPENIPPVEMEDDKVDLSAMITEYMDALFINETDTFGASIKNSSDKLIATDVVWRVAGRQIRKVTVTIPAKGSITDRAKVTMPNTEGSVTVEVEVNPSRNKPANEVTWSNNISRETIISLGSDKIPGTGESDPYLVD